MKRVIITGASEGLGYELTLLLVNKGVEVVSLSRSKPLHGPQKCGPILAANPGNTTRDGNLGSDHKQEEKIIFPFK
jgi:NAD(P)-dependent dehydrogenase (short-subunit alcohol dehydrogenase family)